MTVLPGTLIASKYQISGTPARGGMGDVHPATRLQDGRGVALKLLREELRDLPDALERFRREAIAAGRIHSEHVAEVLDVLDDSELGLAIVFEYLEGESLEDMLKREHKITFEQAHPLVCQILQGLADAHAVPVVHRDLKPANIFLQRMPNGMQRVKLVDFGISKVPQEAGGPVLTKVGQNLGSFSYMAPEQASAPSSVDQRADLYACGTVVFRMLTGQLPYTASSLGELIGKKQRQPPRTLNEVLSAGMPPFAPSVEAFVARMLERRPEARPATAWEALEAWESLAASGGSREARPAPRTAAQPQPARAPAPAAQAGLARNAAPRPSNAPPPRAAPATAHAHVPGHAPHAAAPAPHAAAPAPRAAAPAPQAAPVPRKPRAKTMLGMGPVAAPAPPPPAPEEPRKAPSVPTRIDRPSGAAEQEPVGPRPAAGAPARAAAPHGPGLPRAQAAQRPAPAAPAAAAAAEPPSLPRKPPPPPKRQEEEDDEEEDESPTAMFVHPMPMKYDPDGPAPSAGAPMPAAGAPPMAPAAPIPAAGRAAAPAATPRPGAAGMAPTSRRSGQAAPPPPPTHGMGTVGLGDDEDYSEPPTAIHVPVFKPEEMPGAPPLPAEFRNAAPQAATPQLAAPVMPSAQTPFPPSAVAPPAMPNDGQPHAVRPAFAPPGVAPQAPPATPVALAMQQQPAHVMQQQPGHVMQQQPAQAMPVDAFASPSHPSRVMAQQGQFAQTMPQHDPEAAPVWLKAVALSTVVSALTVLGVLGWMVVSRF